MVMRLRLYYGHAVFWATDKCIGACETISDQVVFASTFTGVIRILILADIAINLLHRRTRSSAG